MHTWWRPQRCLLPAALAFNLGVQKLPACCRTCRTCNVRGGLTALCRSCRTFCWLVLHACFGVCLCVCALPSA